MRTRIILAALLCGLLASCSLTPTQKKWAGIAAGVLVVGAIAARDDSNGHSSATEIAKPGVPCRPQPDGSCR